MSLTCRRKIERVLWVIWIELGLSGEFHGVELSCIIYTRKSGLPVRDRIFENFRKSKYRSKSLIWFLGITHQRVSLEKLWAIRKNWSCPQILDGYRYGVISPPKFKFTIQHSTLQFNIQFCNSTFKSQHFDIQVHDSTLKFTNIGYIHCISYLGFELNKQCSRRVQLQPRASSISCRLAWLKWITYAVDVSYIYIRVFLIVYDE